MPLKSGGAVESEHLKGRNPGGVISIGAPTAAIVLSSYASACINQDGWILIAGSTYKNLPTTAKKIVGTYSLSFDLSEGQAPGYGPDTWYELDHWVVTGGVSVANAYATSTTITITAAGTLQALYKRHSVTYNSKHKTNPCDISAGRIGIWYISSYSYYDPLPGTNNESKQTLACIFDPKATGKIFDHWATTGGVSVADPNANPTTRTVTSSGTLTAIYT